MPAKKFPAPFTYLFGRDFKKFIPFAEFFLRTFFSLPTTRSSPCAVPAVSLRPPVGIEAQTCPHERFGRLFGVIDQQGQFLVHRVDPARGIPF